MVPGSPGAAALLPPEAVAALTAGATLLAAPDGVLVGARQRPVPGRTGREQLRQVGAVLAAAPAGSVVLGAVPFDLDGAGALALATDVRRLPRTGTSGAAPSVPGPVQRVVRSGSRPTPEGYRQAVADAVRRIRAGELAKVVLARSVDVRLLAAPALADVVQRLAAANPAARVLAVPLPGGDPAHRTWLVGATPELLVRRRGREVVCVPLAGSQARSADPAVDAARAARLTGSDKDRREHAFVVEAIVEALRPYCTEVRAPAPELLATPAVWHLATRVTARLRDPATTSADLVTALHPTPAVGGTPRGAATAVIAELEGFDRGCYAGAVGFQDAAGDGEWSVGVRCAELVGNRLRLFAGAGIVAGSDPDAELAETDAKLRTVLGALGLTLEGGAESAGAPRAVG